MHMHMFTTYVHTDAHLTAMLPGHDSIK